MSTYEISKSSLLSLKAEILRKQEELKKVKQQNEIKQSQIKKPLQIKNKGVEQRSEGDKTEDEDLLKKSREALELKAKLYDKLSRRKKFTDEETERNRRFLVRFDRKHKVSDLPPDSDGEIDVDNYPESDEDRHLSDEYESAKNPDEEWVEYTDCLGRTRKCMKKDLQFLKSKDEDLRASIDKQENKQEQLYRPENKAKEKEDDELDLNLFDENSELLSSDMRRELLRQQWEKEEEELLKKDDIHYQDVLFSEARTHGVGYYAFSKDEEQRAKQQEALKRLRKETQQQQQKAQELRSLREKQLAARVKAAKNRKRARLGLPPEEDEPEVEQPPPEEPPLEELETKKKEEEKEKKKDEVRKKHIRPWDIGKKGVKEHYEYTQEEWVDKKRKERPQEFAPPSVLTRGFKSDYKHKNDDDDEPEPAEKTLYFSTKKNKEKKGEDMFDTSTPPSASRKPSSNLYNSKETPSFTPAPIVNECDDLGEDQDRLLQDFYSVKDDSDSNDNHRGRGAEIAPPPTFDYYGPSGAKKSKPNHTKTNLSDSISAGLKFLRQQAEKKTGSRNHPEDMFLF